MLWNRSGSGWQSCLHGDLPQGADPPPGRLCWQGGHHMGTLGGLAGQQPWHRPPGARTEERGPDREQGQAGRPVPPELTPASAPHTRSGRRQEQPWVSGPGCGCWHRRAGQAQGLLPGEWVMETTRLPTRRDRENHVRGKSRVTSAAVTPTPARAWSRDWGSDRARFPLGASGGGALGGPHVTVLDLHSPSKEWGALCCALGQGSMPS